MDAIEMVVRVLCDGSRCDRYLRVTADGEYYTTPSRRVMTDDGPETPPYVAIPVFDCDLSDEDLEIEARAIIQQLDLMV